MAEIEDLGQPAKKRQSARESHTVSKSNPAEYLNMAKSFVDRGLNIRSVANVVPWRKKELANWAAFVSHKNDEWSEKPSRVQPHGSHLYPPSTVTVIFLRDDRIFQRNWT